MPVARRRGDAAGLAGLQASRVTSGCTASSRSRSSASSLTSSSCRRRPPWPTGPTAADRGARGRMGPGRAREYPRRTRQRRTRPGRGTGQEPPGESPLSRRWARREAIGLPRLDNPEDHRLVAGSARWVGTPLGECDQQQVPSACCRRLPPLQVSAGSAGIPPAAVLPRCSPLPLAGSGPSEREPGRPARRRRNRGTRFRGRGRARLPVEGNE
jgi:hypothetical protein